MDDIKRRLEALERGVDKLNTYVIIGNGKPSLRSRADLLESDVDSLKTAIEDIKDEIRRLPESIDKKLTRQTTTITGIVLGFISVFEFILKFIK